MILGNEFGKMKVVPSPERGRITEKLSVSKKNIEYLYECSILVDLQCLGQYYNLGLKRK